MNTEDDTLHLRRLLDELSPREAAEFDEQLAQNPELAARFESLASQWEVLELPPPPTPDPYAATRWLAQWRSRTPSEGFGSPVTSRKMSSAVLAAGLVLGLGLGRLLGPETVPDSSPEVLVAASFNEESSTLADSYWNLIASETDAQ